MVEREKCFRKEMWKKGKDIGSTGKRALALLILWSKCSDIKWNMKEVREEKLLSRGDSQCKGPNVGMWLMPCKNSQAWLGHQEGAQSKGMTRACPVGPYKPLLELGTHQWHPTPGLLPGKSHGRRSLVGCSPWGR